jgi:HipA-like protein
MPRARYEPLNVFLNSRLVGQLRREASGAICFRYDQSWLEWEFVLPVSLSLPLREQEYIGAPVVAVFDNLLPDSIDLRRQIATRTHAGGTDPYSLLAAIGHDCVGALQKRLHFYIVMDGGGNPTPQQRRLISSSHRLADFPTESISAIAQKMSISV